MNTKAIQVLKELAENAGKRSKIGIIRELMPYIEETMQQGVTLAAIHAALTEKAGIDMKFVTFIGSYKRIKKERLNASNKNINPLTPENKMPVSESFEIPSFKHNPVPNREELY